MIIFYSVESLSRSGPVEEQKIQNISQYNSQEKKVLAASIDKLLFYRMTKKGNRVGRRVQVTSIYQRLKADAMAPCHRNARFMTVSRQASKAPKIPRRPSRVVSNVSVNNWTITRVSAGYAVNKCKYLFCVIFTFLSIHSSFLNGTK